MFFETADDDAVSPVVGVILMVAVTVILAAVIGSFVLDLGSNVSANPSAGVTFDQAPDGSNYDVTIQVISMENADSIGLEYNASNTGYEATLTSVGGSHTAQDLSSGTDITVVGELDGKEAVLQTYTAE